MTPTALMVLLTAVNTADPDPRSMAIPPATAARAAALVSQLGAAAFADREAAARELAAMGRLALPALEAGSTSADPEVAVRSRKLLPKARQLDGETRVACFLADTGGKYAHDFPGWSALRSVAGDTPAARRLYADTLAVKSNADLLAALRSAGGVGPQLKARHWELLRAGDGLPPTVADVTALILAEAAAPAPSGDDPGPIILHNALVSEPIRAVLRADEASPFRKLVAHWIVTRPGPDYQYLAMSAAAELGLEEAPAAPLAVKYLDTAVRPDSLSTVTALGVLAETGDKAHLPRLKRHLGDTGVFGVFRKTNGRVVGANTTAGCSVLALAVLLRGEDPAAYGFDFFDRNSRAKYRPESYSFSSPEKRNYAFAKWAFREAFR